MAYNIKNSKKFFKCYFPLRLFLILIGQMPYTQQSLPDGNMRFRFRYISAAFFIYCFVVLIYVFLYTWMTVGMLSFMLGFFEGTETTKVMDPITKQLLTVSYERELIRSQMVPIFVVWSWMTLTVVGAVYLLLHGRSYSHFMNHWSRVVCVVDTDCTQGVERALWMSNLLFLVVLLLLIGMFVVGVTLVPKMTGILSVSDALATFLFRIFQIRIAQTDKDGATITFAQYRLCGFLLILLAYTGSRAIISQFLFFQRLLRNLAWNWDCRLINCLEARKKERKGDQTKRRVDFTRLLKDHLTMVQVFKFTNENFNYAITTYYVMVTVALVLELYHLCSIILLPLVEYTEVMFIPASDGGMVGVDKLEDSENIRNNEDAVDRSNLYEFLLSFVFLCYQGWTCWTVTSTTANAYEAAFAGYTILRRHGFMYCKSKSERNFMWSMYFNYAKSSPAIASASGYFSINRTLFLVLANTIINYSVAMYQLKPEDWNEEDRIVPTGSNPNFAESFQEFFRFKDQSLVDGFGST